MAQKRLDAEVQGKAFLSSVSEGLDSLTDLRIGSIRESLDVGFIRKRPEDKI